MHSRDSSEYQLQRIGRYVVVFMLVWSAAVAASLTINIDGHERALQTEVDTQARAIHAMDMAYRSWVIGHGGVYVPANEKTPPSKYLSHVPERDITTPSGKQLTLLNSSYMNRQVQEMMREQGTPVRSHISSLKPINPVNSPDSWETGALQQFEQGAKEVAGVEAREDGSRYYRFMKPMVTEQACLKCHDHQGYKVGDIRGGISVTVPIDEALAQVEAEEQRLIAGHGLVWLLGLAGMFVYGRQQRKAILAVAGREAEVRLLTNSIAHAIYGMDMQGRCTFANASCIQMLGFSSEKELMGRDMHALIHHSREDGSAYPAEECPSYRVAREGKRIHVEDDIFWRRDGSSFPVEFWSYPVEKDGRQHGSVTTFMDISERKRVEMALRISKERYDNLVRQIPVGVYLYRFTADGSGHFEYVSPKFCEILKLEEATVLKQPETAFVAAHPDDFDSLLMANKRAFETLKPFKWEGRFVVQGQTHWVKIESIPSVRPSGDSLWSGVIEDITERKLIDIELRKSQQTLAEAQKVAKLGNWELDLTTNQLSWSDGIFEIFEIDREKFGASYEAFLEAIHPDDRVKVNTAYTRSVEEHGSYEIIHRLLMSDGRIKIVQEHGQSFYDADGRPVRSVGTVQDITELHEMEEQLRQAQKMEAVGTLVGGIAHDFNNKLAAITGNLYLAQSLISDNPKVQERLEAVERLSFEAASMVQQLLTFARKGKVEKRPLLLTSFIKESAKLNRVAIPEDIQLIIDFGSDPLPVMGDIIQLQQVFLNLLNNARDALSGVEKPRIEVLLKRYEPDAAFCEAHPEAKSAEAFACLQVRDNGSGIAEENLDHLFDPFFTTKEVGKGTGLGLAMVYGVVTGHDGIIDVESKPGEGACFSIYLPINSFGAGESSSTELDEPVPGKGETILIADDDQNVLEVLGGVLTSLNYKVLKAHDGQSAVELFGAHADEIDLVILDIVMPEMKGPDAAREIRKIRDDVKILYATGYDSHQQKGRESRDADVLEKPYRFERVSRVIRQLLDN